jgi:hypothetical protein
MAEGVYCIWEKGRDEESRKANVILSVVLSEPTGEAKNPHACSDSPSRLKLIGTKNDIWECTHSCTEFESRIASEVLVHNLRRVKSIEPGRRRRTVGADVDGIEKISDLQIRGEFR